MQQLPDGAAAPLGAAQEEVARLRLDDLTVLVVHRAVMLEDNSYSPPVPTAASFYSTETPTETYPHNKGHVVFVVVSGAAAEDV